MSHNVALKCQLIFHVLRQIYQHSQHCVYAISDSGIFPGDAPLAILKCLDFFDAVLVYL
jgi:hypothetical protein